ncbi:hypothetical protein HIM_02447 [Hirsutella minnesotensis 3608]|nr:hypothetical protein HIM_02447 [Hirsutella minnesotensis 3608]
MPMHNGFIPREGFCLDVLIKAFRLTALNPALILPLALLARLTKRGQDFSILHPKAAKTLSALLYWALARRASAWLSDKVRNNWADDRYDWSKEIVLVTGGAGGIGGSMVRLLEEKGITVVVLDIQPMSFTASSRVHYFHCDIRSPEKVQAVADVVRAKVGHPTIIINNAGVVRGKTILDAEPGDVRFTFDVNTLAHYWIAKAFLPNIIKRNHGMIVTISSVGAWLNLPNMVDYCASKAAAMSFHEGLSAELATVYNAPKVRTVLAHPGHVKTSLFEGFSQGSSFMTPSLEPDSIAEAVVKQVLAGRSARIILPSGSASAAALRVLPDWYAYRLRTKKLKDAMSGFRGRQVLRDVDAPYVDEPNSLVKDTSESTVLVGME